MNTKNFFRFSALFALALPLVACELLVDFDRTKIPADDAGTAVDSSIPIGDASTDSAVATDSATAPDAIVPVDAATTADSGIDASTDAGARDGSADGAP
jgi:hypothetical protein